MKLRWFSLALFALVLGTAFAPAPFARTSRKSRNAELLARLQGTWKIETKERMGPNNELATMTTSQKVVIEESFWRFASSFEGKGGKAKAPKGGFGGGKARGKGPTRRYEIVFTPGTSPQGFRLVRGTRDSSEDYMVGILAIEGNTVKVMYKLTRSDETSQHPPPGDFETIPEGWYRMTLRREK